MSLLNDMNYVCRLETKRKRLLEHPEPRTVSTYDSDGIAIRIPVSSIPDQGPVWLGIKDSNLDKQSQSLWCYRYTNSQFGGGEGDRTPDPRLAKPVLSQLSYAPKVAESTGIEPVRVLPRRISNPLPYH